jgi:hypothetical protein
MTTAIRVGPSAKCYGHGGGENVCNHQIITNSSVAEFLAIEAQTAKQPL